MSTKDEFCNRIDELVEKADDVIGTTKHSSGDRVDGPLYIGFRAQALNFLDQCVSKESQFYESFKAVMDQNRYWPSNVKEGRAILLALKQDIEKGYLRTVRELVNAEIFVDFIEMAEYLLSENYKDAAAVIAGSVLEEHLRQLAHKNGVALETQNAQGKMLPKKATVLNAELCKQNVYNKAKEKQITAWQDIRNSAAHGAYAEYTAVDVKLLVQGVVSFIADYPA